jgi:hypothetical protein
MCCGGVAMPKDTMLPSIEDFSRAAMPRPVCGPPAPLGRRGD